MTALVLGAAGQLGVEIVRLTGGGSGLTREQLSITDAAAVEAVIEERRPQVVFNCAAYNAVDRAESEPDAAFAVNAEGPLNVAVSCVRHGARFVHFSTNFVFDGGLDRPYVESDAPAPLGVYGHSKVAGERQVLEAMPDALILRTAAVFGGRRGDSFPEKILQRATSGSGLRVVADQKVNPTYTVDLAAAAVRLAGEGWTGVVHAVAAGCSAWDEFARAVLEEAGMDVPVESIPSSAYPTPAARPLNGCLTSTRLAPLRGWREALHEWSARAKNP